ncbi:MAG: hypothetical protein ACI957_003003, partial [Verrucomicrobiales bacterium]
PGWKRGVAWWIYEAAWNSALRERHTASSPHELTQIAMFSQ